MLFALISDFSGREGRRQFEMNGGLVGGCSVLRFGLVKGWTAGKIGQMYGWEIWRLRRLPRSHDPSWFIYQIPGAHFKCIPGTEESAFVIYFHFKEPFYKRGTQESEKISFYQGL